jgi:hypothetical protein
MKRTHIAIWITLAGLLIGSCRSAEPEPTPTPPPQETPPIVLTAEAILTADAIRRLTPTVTPVTPTATPEPATPTPGPTATDSPPTVVVLCDNGHFVDDVTVPDGTEFAPGTPFTKTWRIQNIGVCTWSPTYEVVFSSGDQMGAPAALTFTTVDVPPGDTVDISIDMVAPLTAGSYKGLWLLKNDDGETFGLEGFDFPFYVEIVVGEAPTATPTPTETPEP